MKTSYLIFTFLISITNVAGQGCIAIRNLTGFGQFVTPEYDEEPVKWMVNVNSRYFTSYEEFVGSTNLHVPSEDRKVNHIFVMDVAFTRVLDNGWSITVDVPVTGASRAAWQEHENNPQDKTKHTTHSFGLSDVRVALFKWLLDVSTYTRGNVQLGLGLKLPTGDYNFQDYFYKAEGKVVLPVNQSIQLGDGGTGISFELNSFYTINKKFSLYGNAFYLFNPRDQNGTYSGTKNSANSGGAVNSVPDAYTFRIGGNMTINKLVLWAGGRMEGLPVHDVLGGSNGNRRPGQIISIEPGVNFTFKEVTVYGFFPFPVYRATKQSVPDKYDGLPSPGGFSNYMIFIGTFFKI